MSDASRRKASAPKRLVTVRNMTPEEASARKAEFATMAERQMEAMRQRWEKSGCTDSACLRAVLLLCGATVPLPSWAVWGLLDVTGKQIEQMRPPYHGARWMLVREALDRGLSLDEAYEQASLWSQGTPAACGPDMIQKSYQKIERSLPPEAKALHQKRKRSPLTT
jgi:hypothetical protein